MKLSWVCCQFVAVEMSQICQAVCRSICTKAVKIQECKKPTLCEEVYICTYPSHVPPPSLMPNPQLLRNTTPSEVSQPIHMWILLYRGLKTQHQTPD